MVRAEEPSRAAECTQADLRRVDGVQHGEALEQLQAESRADLRAAGQTGRQSVADDDPRAVLDDLKRGAEHARLQRSRTNRGAPAGKPAIAMTGCGIRAPLSLAPGG